MEVDDSSKLLIELMHWKSIGGTSDRGFQRLRKILESRFELPSIHTALLHLQTRTGFQCRRIDCCKNSCLAYTGEYSD
jgi:hypothetical protein